MILQSSAVDLETPTGEMRTYVYEPVEKGKYPGLLLYSEIFQLTAPVSRLAAFMAGQGFVVAVPEIYHEYLPLGTILNYDKEGTDKGNALKTTKPVSNFDSDARAVVDFLRSHSACSTKLGSIGICIGGHLAFRAAFNQEILATACFYSTDLHSHSLGAGKNDDSLQRVSEIQGELLMIWGKQDPHIPDTGRRLIHDTLLEAKTNFTWHEFNAQHAFMRDEGHRYDPALALLCHDLVLNLFRRRL